MQNRTLVIIKRDTIERGLVGKIITRFEEANPKIKVARVMYKQFPRPVFEEHYKHIKNTVPALLFKNIIRSMSSRPLWFLELTGEDAARRVKEMAGATDPKVALPGTIRRDLGVDSMKIAISELRALHNLIHASDPEAAEKEIKRFFD